MGFAEGRDLIRVLYHFIKDAFFFVLLFLSVDGCCGKQRSQGQVRTESPSFLLQTDTHRLQVSRSRVMFRTRSGVEASSQIDIPQRRRFIENMRENKHPVMANSKHNNGFEPMTDVRTLHKLGFEAIWKPLRGHFVFFV